MEKLEDGGVIYRFMKGIYLIASVFAGISLT